MISFIIGKVEEGKCICGIFKEKCNIKVSNSSQMNVFN